MELREWAKTEPQWYLKTELAEFMFTNRNHTYINSNGVVRVFLNEQEKMRHVDYLCFQIGVTDLTFQE